MLNREDLIAQYAESIVEGMDMETLAIYAIEQLMDGLRTMTDTDLTAEIEDFYPLWKEWRLANHKYIDPVITANSVLSCVRTKKSEDLTHITDIWTQAVIYYYIWFKFNIEVPHNDFADFFTDTDQIKELVK